MERSYYAQLHHRPRPLKPNVIPEQQRQIGSTLSHSTSALMCQMILIKVLYQTDEVIVKEIKFYPA